MSGIFASVGEGAISVASGAAWPAKKSGLSFAPITCGTSLLPETAGYQTVTCSTCCGEPRHSRCSAGVMSNCFTPAVTGPRSRFSSS
jgi:hypothetical protein